MGHERFLPHPFQLIIRNHPNIPHDISNMIQKV